jgi:amidase
MSASDWKALIIDKKKRQQAAIPKEWRIALPPTSQLHVLHVPRECGLLDSDELLITETNVHDLLAKLAAGEWTSVAVTRAFYKRAIIAHQLVR